MIDPSTGVVATARQISSPNCDERCDRNDISLLVIHNISLPPDEYGGPWIDALFTNSLDPDAHPYFKEIYELKVSSHLLIRRTGELVQYVPFTKRAWHAGKSIFLDREACNDFSIGIELEGSDDIPYTDEQYAMVSKVSRAIMVAYPNITTDRIVGHSDIAPGRKTDPGSAFDWERFRQLLDSR